MILVHKAHQRKRTRTIDTAKLKGKIVENGLSQKKEAKYLGITSETFYTKMQKGVFKATKRLR